MHDQAFPLPHAEFRGKSNPSTQDVTAIAEAWQPKDCDFEQPLSTLSRYALRLIDKETGKAYAADELLELLETKRYKPYLDAGPINFTATTPMEIDFAELFPGIDLAKAGFDINFILDAEGGIDTSRMQIYLMDASGMWFASLAPIVDVGEGYKLHVHLNIPAGALHGDADAENRTVLPGSPLSGEAWMINGSPNTLWSNSVYGVPIASTGWGTGAMAGTTLDESYYMVRIFTEPVYSEAPPWQTVAKIGIRIISANEIGQPKPVVRMLSITPIGV